MARRMEIAEAADNSVRDELPTQIAAVPLVLDDNLMEADNEEDIEDIEEEMVRQRNNGARTLFHQPRGDNDTLNSTQSLYDADIVYTTIHGRRYCGNYFLPNDVEEQDRGQMLHVVYLHILDNEYTTVPLRNPEKILDIGTGTGEWAMAMADEYPNAEVIGTDIANIQPGSGAINVFFEIDDAEEEGGWTWPDKEFDLVHFRSMAGAFRDWNKIYSEAFRVLKPGAYIEVMDFDNHSTFLSYFAADSPLFHFMEAVSDAWKLSGRVRSSEHLSVEMLRAAGFGSITVTEKTIPMGIWPEDKEERAIGKHFLVAQLCGVESLCMRPLTERGWDIEEIRRICSEVTNDVMEMGMDPVRGRGLCSKVRILTGRKPCSMELVVPDGQSVMGDSIRTVTQTNGGGVNGGS